MNKMYLFTTLVLLVPATIFLVPAQAQEDPSLAVSTTLSGVKDLPLKAIQQSDGTIETRSDFEIEPDDIITLEKGQDFQVLSNQGAIEAVKITDERKQTTDMQFSQSGIVNQDLASKAYMLDIIIQIENDKYLYETILAILEPGQTLNLVNIQNIIQNFVTTTSNTDTKIIFKDADDNEEEEPSICYFEPNTAPECKPLPDGTCPNNWPMNEDGNCHPGGECPDNYSRVDDDETGTCYPDDDITICEGSGALVLDEDDCAIYAPDIRIEPQPDDFNRTLPNVMPPTPEPTDRCWDINAGKPMENCKEVNPDTDDTPDPPLEEETANCGGVPCTPTEKEDSTTDEPEEEEESVPETIND